jgi:DNA polymerase-3 subunit gamma/tau
MVAMNDLVSKYRPKALDAVRGQDAAVRALEGVLKKKSSRSLIFHGPSGTGKTTLARIVASQVGCQGSNLTEVDAATHTGIDAMREITGKLNYTGLGKSQTRVIIVDEAHALSKVAWQSLLKSVEEPPAHAYWIFCTTEPDKIPATIRTRCASFALKSVGVSDLKDLIQEVAKAEGMKVQKEILSLMAKEAGGSPRQALSNLAICSGCKTTEEAAALLQTGSESAEVIDLCRALMKGRLSWKKAMDLIRPLKDMNGESIRQVVVAYFSSVALGGRDPELCLSILEAFGEPYPSQAKIYPVILSLGMILMGEE